MAQTTRLVSFGPVFCPSRFPTLPALSSITLALLLFVFSGRCCRCCVVVIEVSEEVVVVLVIDVVVNVVVVVVMPGCRGKYLHRIIFYGKYIFLYGSVVMLGLQTIQQYRRQSLVKASQVLVQMSLQECQLFRLVLS